jgi:hypothetical protein
MTTAVHFEGNDALALSYTGIDQKDQDDPEAGRPQR